MPDVVELAGPNLTRQWAAGLWAQLALLIWLFALPMAYGMFLGACATVRAVYRRTGKPFPGDTGGVLLGVASPPLDDDGLGDRHHRRASRDPLDSDGARSGRYQPDQG